MYIPEQTRKDFPLSMKNDNNTALYLDHTNQVQDPTN